MVVTAIILLLGALNHKYFTLQLYSQICFSHCMLVSLEMQQVILIFKSNDFTFVHVSLLIYVDECDFHVFPLISAHIFFLI